MSFPTILARPAARSKTVAWRSPLVMQTADPIVEAVKFPFAVEAFLLGGSAIGGCL